MKLKEYFDKNGISKRWFAVKIGINPSHFYEIVNEKKRVPEKYMKKIVKLTEEKISIKDLMEHNLKYFERIEDENNKVLES